MDPSSAEAAPVDPVHNPLADAAPAAAAKKGRHARLATDMVITEERSARVAEYALELGVAI